MKKKIIDSSIPEYWEASYQSGEMGWDLHGHTPVFDDWINAYNKELSICVLGAGNGWDAINFATKGHNVTAVDFAESAVLNMNKLAELNGVKINPLQMDIFDLKKEYKDHFDIVLEYTCYCAIDPARRTDYIDVVSHILKPQGEFVALLFPLDKNMEDGGPPFAVDLESTIALFSNHLTLVKKEKSLLSISPRKEREIFVIFNKNED